MIHEKLEAIVRRNWGSISAMASDEFMLTLEDVSFGRELVRTYDMELSFTWYLFRVFMGDINLGGRACQ